MNPIVTIFTPTYNRVEKLERCYSSLVAQSNLNFEWLVIDDGSSDDTEKMVNKWKKKSDISIRYYKKDNGGKHTAHNHALSLIRTKLTFILDSDDFLTKDAVEQIYRDWEIVNKNELAGIMYPKVTTNFEWSGDYFKKDFFIDNLTKVSENTKKKGELATVWVTDILRKHPFPIFKHEKYMPEGAIWHSISKDYDVLFVNKPIYIYEYQKEGLTKSGRTLRINNPNGQIYAAIVGMSGKHKLKTKIKNVLLYICYGFFGKKTITSMYKKCPIKSSYILFLPLGFVLFVYWKYKYS